MYRFITVWALLALFGIPTAQARPPQVVIDEIKKDATWQKYNSAGCGKCSPRVEGLASDWDVPTRFMIGVPKANMKLVNQLDQCKRGASSVIALSAGMRSWEREMPSSARRSWISSTSLGGIRIWSGTATSRLSGA